MNLFLIMMLIFSLLKIKIIFINKQIEINYIISLIENNPLNMAFPFTLKETSSENREDVIINLPSNQPKSKSNISQDIKDIIFEKKTR